VVAEVCGSIEDGDSGAVEFELEVDASVGEVLVLVDVVIVEVCGSVEDGDSGVVESELEVDESVELVT